MGLNFTAAGMLRKVIRKYNPDMVVCWDVAATEQLQAAILGSRRRLTVMAMLFQEDRASAVAIEIELSQHRFASGVRLGSGGPLGKGRAGYQSAGLSYLPRFRANRGTRRSAGFTAGYWIGSGQHPDFFTDRRKAGRCYQGLIACGIVERVEHRLRVLVSGYDAERADRCYHFVNRTVGVPICGLLATGMSDR